MKLELKHLAAYFPYGLSIFSGDSNVEYLLTGINYNKKEYERSIRLSENDTRYYIQNIKYCKPILRPLDDLFFNLNIENKSQKPFEYLEDFADTETERIFLDVIENESIKYVCEKIQYAPMSIIEKLLEWHFDIFGLINAGLAFDENCL